MQSPIPEKGSSRSARSRISDPWQLHSANACWEGTGFVVPPVGRRGYVFVAEVSMTPVLKWDTIRKSRLRDAGCRRMASPLS